MKRNVTLLVTLVILAVPVVAFADNRENWHYHRATGNKAEIILIDSLRDGWTRPLKKVVAALNETEAFLTVRVVKGSDKKSVRQLCGSPGGTPLQVRVCDGSWPEFWAGQASVAYSNGHVTGARIRFNMKHMRKPNRHVICHEVGHLLGLAHRSSGESCMVQGSVHPWFDAHDLLELEEIYDHGH